MNVCQLVVFSLDDRQYALRHLSSVEKVVHAVQVTALPKAPEMLLGLVNVHGQIVPVVNIRKRFCLPHRDADTTDLLVIAKTSRRLGFFADTVTGIVEVPSEAVVSANKLFPGLEHIDGIAKLKDGMILIDDLDQVFSPEEEQALDKALSSRGEQ